MVLLCMAIYFIILQDYILLSHQYGNSLDSSKQSRCANRPGDFSYGTGPSGPDNWPAMFDTCTGEKQSPINIDMSDLENLKVGPLQWSSAYFNTPKSMTLTNRDHSLILRASYPEDCYPMLSGGALHKPYKFSSIDFHWGSRDSKGSEHTIDEFAYPMEMHVIHNGGEGTEALSRDVMIVTYFFQISEQGCSSMNHILKVLVKALKRPYDGVNLKTPFTLASLARPFSSEYVMYKGSLTKPPCTEGIKWIIYPFPLDITEKQLEQFRQVCKYAPDLEDNYRPVQRIGQRKVYFVT